MAKDNLITSLTMIFEEPLHIAEYYGVQLLYNDKIINIKNYQNMIATVSLESINQVMKDIINFDYLNIVCVGTLSKNSIEQIFP